MRNKGVSCAPGGIALKVPFIFMPLLYPVFAFISVTQSHFCFFLEISESIDYAEISETFFERQGKKTKEYG